jgi:2-alkenal reductase
MSPIEDKEFFVMDGMPMPSANRVRRLPWFPTLIAALLFAFLAINAPITFAQSASSTIAQSPSAQQSNGLATTSSSAVLLDQSVETVAKQANPAVVTITNLQNPVNPRTGRSSSALQPVDSGSGFIISTDGYVITNNHVIEGGTSFQVQFMDGTTVDATLVGADPIQDVAVLKLDLKSGQSVPGTLSFGDSSSVEAGQQVVAIGTPYGEYANSVSTGIVNAVNRSLDEGNGLSMPNLIQHDAPIYPGNSGGPLLNLSGEVIGMNVAAATDPTTGGQTATGIYFAIDSNAVKGIVDTIIKTGKYDRAYIGIQSQPTQDGSGVQIVSVEPGTPAETAGLQTGDVITAVDGNTFTAKDPFANQLLFDHKPGDTVKLTVERDGSEITVSVTLGVRPATTQ